MYFHITSLADVYMLVLLLPLGYIKNVVISHLWQFIIPYLLTNAWMGSTVVTSTSMSSSWGPVNNKTHPTLRYCFAIFHRNAIQQSATSYIIWPLPVKNKFNSQKKLVYINWFFSLIAAPFQSQIEEMAKKKLHTLAIITNECAPF